MLGNYNALNTMVFQVGFHFALRSGNEHQRLRHSPSQITLFEPPSEHSYFVYREDISKTNQGGLSSHKKKPKEVYQYANLENLSRCLYKLYSSKCSTDRHANAFYFTPLARSSVVFQSPSWSQRAWKCHQWCDEAGWIKGHYTNTPIIPLEYPWPVPGFLMHKRIMSRTGHSSTDGVRPYKRASNKLKKVTSDVLNQSAQPATKTVESEQEKRSKDEAIKPASQAEPPLKRPCF